MSNFFLIAATIRLVFLPSISSNIYLSLSLLHISLRDISIHICVFVLSVLRLVLRAERSFLILSSQNIVTFHPLFLFL